MRKAAGRLLAFGMILCLLLGLMGAAGADGLHQEIKNDLLDVEILPGYDGAITYGKPFPVRVTVRNRGEELNAVVAVNAYVSPVKYDRYEAEIFVPAGGERTVLLPVTAQTRQDTLTAEIVRDGKVICAVNTSPESVINPSAMMVGVLSTRPRNLAMLDISAENDTQQRYEYWKTVALTPETLPDSAELLDAFGMIVLDDTDPALLTEKQQETLKNWVRKGRVLICGGGTAAPRNLALIADMAGLRAEDFTVSNQVYRGLERYLGRISEERYPEITLAKITGAEPMVGDVQGNGLIWRTTAGAGRIYTLAWEAGDPALNSESLMHTFFQQMLVNADSALYNSILYTSDNYNPAQVSAGDSAPVPVRSPLPAAAAIIGGLIAVSCAAWVLLKKHGASKWMWVILPVLSLIAAGAVTLMSMGSSMNSTIAAATVNKIQDTQGNVKRYVAVSAASPRTGLHSYSMEGETLAVEVYDGGYYWDEEEEDKPEEPAVLRLVHRAGERNETSINGMTPWERVNMSAQSAETGAAGRVEGEIWMESDGLHGTVTNRTEYTLKDGAVLCGYGFALVPDLRPGESADFALVSSMTPDPYDPVFEDGKMIRNSNVGMYQVVYQRYIGKNGGVYTEDKFIYCNMANGAASQISRDRTGSDGYEQDNATFLYSARPEGAGEAALYADGQEIKSKSVYTLLNAELTYLPIGKTGVVFRAPGMDTPVRCEIDSQGLPAGDVKEKENLYNKYGYNYFPLREKPTFRFSPEGLKDMDISSLMITMADWYANESKCYVLNIKRKIWVEVKMNEEITRPEQYVDKDGNLFCQFRAVSADTYMEITAPSLSLEGRVKNAQP